MRYRSNGVETVHLVARFEPGATVTMTVFDLATLGAVSLSSNVCSEIGSTGLFRWPSSSLSSQPSTYTQYVATMTDTNGVTRSQKFVLGGAMDNLDVASSTRAVESTVAKEATLAAQAALILADTALVLSTGGTGPWTTATGFSIAGDAMTLTTGERDAVADAVWDEALAGHLGVGSTGEALDQADATADPATVADAVWDEARAGHATLGSFGEQLQTAPATAADVSATETAIRGADSRDLSELAGAGFDAAEDTLEALGGGVEILRDHIVGTIEIDTTTDPWTEVHRAHDGIAIIQRYDLFDGDGTAINNANPLSNYIGRRLRQ